VRGSCSPGSTTSCTDVCGNHLSCTCYSGSWWCDQEC
jgi:hypothetical protein